MASVPPQGGRKHPNQDFLQIDTTNILFICGGAFAGLEKVIENRTEASGIGFGAAVRSKKQRSLTEVYLDIEPEDLIKFGLIPELVGRMPVVTALARVTGLPACFVRKKAKEYGTARFAEGADVGGRRVLVVEDVITSGGQAVLSTADLRGIGALVSDVVCVIDRSEGGREALAAEGLTLSSVVDRRDLDAAGA